MAAKRADNNPSSGGTGVTAPGLAAEQLVEAFRQMLFARNLSERGFILQRQGRMGTIAGAQGQEAAIVGSMMALERGRDWVVPQYRELAAMVYHGVPLVQIFQYFMGAPRASRFPAGTKVLPIQIALAAQLPHAVGLGWGLRHQGDDGVVLVYFGEGAASEGDAHEAMNLAGVRKAPVVFMLQNNGWAISTPLKLQTAAESLAARAEGYGIAGEQVDGNDVLAVHEATARAVARARAGEGATLIEAITYRMGPHNTADDPTRYVEPEAFEPWEGMDPIDRARERLEAEGLLEEGVEDELRTAIGEEIAAAAAAAETSAAAGPEGLFEEVYADPGVRLQRQRSELVEENR